jgi:N-hydroxyarylamine O-acetyltransferase
MDALSSPQLQAYLRRIGLPAAVPPPDAATLARVVEAHSLHCPFENLDLVLGRAISLELPALVAKLVDGGRGGLCCEANSLMAAALLALGFRVSLRSARVWMRSERYDAARPSQPRLHMLLVVRCPSQSDGEWLVDVGFGGGGPPVPLPLVPLTVTHSHGEAYKLTRGEAGSADDDFSLWSLCSGDWRRLYSFEQRNVCAADFLPALHFVCTVPNSLVRVRRGSPRARASRGALSGAALCR